MPENRFLNPPTIPAPRGYTHVVETAGPARTIYLSGQLGMTPDGKFAGGAGDFRAQATRSCVTPISAVGDAKVTTLAGLGTPEKPHPLQTAYVEEQVPQCGYCINGWIMTAADFLAHKKNPSEAEIKDALSGIKCRCGTHISILKAVKRAATMMG